MSFRKYGGMNYAATHNIVKSNVNTTDTFYVTNNVGQTNSYINFDSDISGIILIFGELDISGNLHVSKDIDCSGNLTVVGNSYFYDDMDISANLHVSNNIDCSGNLTVDGKSYFYDDMDISANLHVSKNIDCSGNLTVDGKSYFYDMDISNNIDCSGNLTVDGNSYFIGAMDASAIFLTANKSITSYTDNEVVPKSYVDSASQGLSVKAPCQCIATGQSYSDSTSLQIDFLNNGYTYTLPITIDGYDLSGNASPPNRVLFNNQGTPDTSANVFNGIYDVSLNVYPSVTFVRSGDMQNGSDALGAYTFIQNGNLYTKSAWVQSQRIDSSGTPVIVGTAALLFVEYQSFKYRMGRGLDLLYNSSTNYTYLNVDTSLNFINYLDNSSLNTINPPVNVGIINIGAYTQQINIGSTNQVNQINITGNVDISGNVDVSGNANFSQDILVNGLTVGRGGGNVDSNTAFGVSALTGTTITGIDNTAVGYKALRDNQTGDYNTAVGWQALSSNTGTSNTAVGTDALQANQNGGNNTSVGMQSLYSNFNGGDNTATGYQALHETTAGNNTAFGSTSLFYNETGTFNTAIGYQSGYTGLATANFSCTFLGALTGNISSIGYNNSTAIGYGALISQDNQIVLGTSAEGVYLPGNYLKIGTPYTSKGYGGYALDISGCTSINGGSTGAVFPLTLIGPSAQAASSSSLNFGFNMGQGSNTNLSYTGDNIIFWADKTGANVSAGLVIAPYNVNKGIRISNDGLSVNTAAPTSTSGYALYVTGKANFTQDILVQELTVGLGNGTSQTTAVGYNALQQNTGASNTAIGFNALNQNLGGSQNTALGHNTLTANTTGSSNTALGYQSLYANTTGYDNTAVGREALFKNTTGYDNTAIGYQALYDNSGGYYNTAIGQKALYSNISGLYNTAVGKEAGNYNSSQNNQYCTFLGDNTGNSTSGSSYSYSSAIGSDAVISASNQIVLGTGDEGVYIPGDYLKIGGSYNKSSGYALDVSGSLNATSIGSNLLISMLNAVYPIGSIYMSYTSSSNPNIILNWSASTWTQIGPGISLVSSGTGFNLAATGGTATANVSVTGSSSHYHGWITTGGQGNAIRTETTDYDGAYSGDNVKIQTSNNHVNGTYNTSSTNVTITSTGTINTYSPYLCVATWRRTG